MQDDVAVFFEGKNQGFVKWEGIDMNWIIGAACILAALAVLGIFTAGVAVTIAGSYQTD